MAVIEFAIGAVVFILTAGFIGRERFAKYPVLMGIVIVISVASTIGAMYATKTWFESIVNDRIAEIPRAAAPVPASTSKPPPSNPERVSPKDYEFEFWRAARVSDTEQAYQQYLDRYPEGEFAALSRERIVQLRGGGIDGPAPDDQAWEVATTANSTGSYNDYLRQFPMGRHASEATKRRSELETRAKVAEDPWALRFGNTVVITDQGGKEVGRLYDNPDGSWLFVRRDGSVQRGRWFRSGEFICTTVESGPTPLGQEGLADGCFPATNAFRSIGDSYVRRGKNGVTSFRYTLIAGRP